MGEVVDLFTAEDFEEVAAGKARATVRPARIAAALRIAAAVMRPGVIEGALSWDEWGEYREEAADVRKTLTEA